MSRIKLIVSCVFIAAAFAAAAVCVTTWYRTRTERIADEGSLVETLRMDGEKAPAERQVEARYLEALDRYARMLPEESVSEGLTRVWEAKPDWITLRESIAMYAQQSPEATADWVVGHLSKGGNRAFALHVALWNWVMKDPEAALAWAGGLSPEQGRECALRSVFQAWAKSDPETAARQLELVQDFQTRSLSFGAVAYYWACEDLHAATGWAWNLPEGPGRDYALANIVRRLYESGRTADIPWVGKLPAGRVRDAAIRGIASLLAAEDPDAAAAWIARQIPGGLGPDPVFQIQIASWALQDPDGAAAWAGQLCDDREREHALSTVAQALAPTDPERASILAEAMPAGAKKNSTVYRIASDWAGEDVDAATEWARQLDDEDALKSALDGVKSQAQKKRAETPAGEAPAQEEPVAEEPPDGQQAEAAAPTFTPGGGAYVGRQEVILTCATPDATICYTTNNVEPAGNDPAVVNGGSVQVGVSLTLKAKAWKDGLLPSQVASANYAIVPVDVYIWPWPQLVPAVEQLPDGPLRDALGHKAAVEWSREANPEIPIAWLIEQFSEGRVLDTALRVIIYEWTSRDPDAAIAWAGEQSDQHRREQAFFSVILELAASGVVEKVERASDVLKDLSAGENRNNAISIIAFRWAILDSAAATEWAGGLTDEQERELALEKIRRAGSS